MNNNSNIATKTTTTTTKKRFEFFDNESFVHWKWEKIMAIWHGTCDHLLERTSNNQRKVQQPGRRIFFRFSSGWCNIVRLGKVASLSSQALVLGCHFPLFLDFCIVRRFWCLLAVFFCHWSPLFADNVTTIESMSLSRWMFNFSEDFDGGEVGIIIFWGALKENP